MTNKITYLFLETHNWGKTVKYWQQIGYEVDLDLGTSGRMVNAAGGPALFITEMPEGHELSTQIAIRTDEEGWKPEPPVEVNKDWHDSHCWSISWCPHLHLRCYIEHLRELGGSRSFSSR